MPDFNQVIVTGRLTADAVTKIFPNSGKKFAEFSVANNIGYGDYAKVNYFKCFMVGDKRVDNISQYLIKGKNVLVSGEMEMNNWIGKDGTNNKDWKLNVADIVFLQGGKKEETKSDELPFEEDQLKRQAEERWKKEVPY